MYRDTAACPELGPGPVGAGGGSPSAGPAVAYDRAQGGAVLVAMVLWGCARVPVPTVDEAGQVQLVGVLHRHGTPACRGDDPDVGWYGRHWVVGFTPLVADEGLLSQVGALAERPVVVSGSPTERSPPPPEFPSGVSGEHCPVMQMRSDYVDTPGGVRIRHDPRPRPPGFATTAVEPFDGLRATVTDDTVQVVFENTLGVALSDVALVVHYEGCMGKPGSTAARTEHGGAAPGETVVARHPAVQASDRGDYRAHSIEVSGGGPAVTLDLDARLPEVGADRVPCPGRE